MSTRISRSLSSNLSDEYSDDDLFHPEGLEEDPLLQSTDSRASSLWKQYSLINKSMQSQTKPDYCICCGNSAFRHLALKIIFLLVVGVGLVSSILMLRFSTFSTKIVTITGGDQMLIPISTYFNKEVIVHSPKRPEELSMYVLPKIPPISKKTFSYNDGVRFHLPSLSYQYWGLHLLEGTEVMISVCADLHMKFYILKSENKLTTWKQTSLFYQFDYSSSIRPQKNCLKKRYFKSHLLKVKETDIYYVIFSSSLGWRFLTEVTVTLHFNRTYYKFDDYKSKCNVTNVKGCHGKIDYASDDVVLIQAMSNLTHPLSSFYKYDLSFFPLPRWRFYLHLFGYIYLVVVFLTVLYSFWRFSADLIWRKSDDGARKPLLQGGYKRHSYSLREPTPGTAPYQRSASVGSYLPSAMKGAARTDGDESDGSDDASLHHRAPNLSNVNSQSIDSLYNRTSASRNDQMRIQRQFMEDQQLLDSIMTSAGISAI